MERVSDMPQLPSRDPNGHKGTFGSVLVIGGHARNPVMLGGPALAARAALRSGCGLCTLAMPAPLLAPALSVASSATGCELPVDAHGELLASAAAEALDPVIERAQAIRLADAGFLLGLRGGEQDIGGGDEVFLQKIG